MPQTGVVTILEVDHKSGIGKNDKPYTIYKVKASDGNQYDTFDAPLAQQARDSNGSPVVIDFEERITNKDGKQYTNYYLKGVSLANGSVPAAVAAPAVAHPPASLPLAPSTSPDSVGGPSTFAQEKDARITRLSAASTAYAYAAAAGLNEGQAHQLAQDIEQYALTGNLRGVLEQHQDSVAVAPQAQPAQQGPGEIPWA